MGRLVVLQGIRVTTIDATVGMLGSLLVSILQERSEILVWKARESDEGSRCLIRSP